PMSRIVGELTWSTTSNFILTAIPFYIMFGEILLRSGTAERMYAALVQWFSWLPGGLMHSNIGACALFGSVSGSSVATAATVGIVGALAITAQRGRLSWRMLRDVCEGTVRTTAMVVAILVGAFFLNVIIQTIGLTQQLSKLISAYQMTPVQVLWAVIVLYLVL